MGWLFCGGGWSLLSWRLANSGKSKNCGWVPRMVIEVFRILFVRHRGVPWRILKALHIYSLTNLSNDEGIDILYISSGDPSPLILSWKHGLPSRKMGQRIKKNPGMRFIFNDIDEPIAQVQIQQLVANSQFQSSRPRYARDRLRSKTNFCSPIIELKKVNGPIIFSGKNSLFLCKIIKILRIYP
jgi:hypothetical protein